VRLGRAGGDGAHRVQVLAVDLDGEATLTPPAVVRIDGTPPTVRVRAAGRHAVSVRVRDAGSGVAAAATRISFGDGHFGAGHARVRHRYAHAGRYRIVLHVRDKVGNRAVIVRTVTVR
jgi:hypothetical protein